MKTTRLQGWTGILGSLLFSTLCHASSVGTSVIPQPVHFGGRSDPARIPLGEVAVITNHAFGRLEAIVEARPCPDGPITWGAGSEFNQNLASVFGISLEEGDLGVTPKEPVILRLKPWKAPADSPYTKDQVLAATLWCILDGGTWGTPDDPLEIRVIAEAEEDKPLEGKYSGKYVNTPGKDNTPVPDVKLPGTRLEKDTRGISWVVFTDIKSEPRADLPQPSFIPFKNWATESDEDSGYALLPIWGNGGDARNPLELVFWSSNICYRRFNGHGREEANQLVSEAYPGNCKATSDESGHDVFISHPTVSQETLAQGIRALVMTALPTVERPLRLRIVMEESRLPYYPAFRNLPGWEETADKPMRDYRSFQCIFACEPGGTKLVQGSYPVLANPVPGDEDRYSAMVKQEELGRKVRALIQEGIASGTLPADGEIPQSSDPQSPLIGKLATAGYFTGLASTTNRIDPWQIPVTNPLSLEETAFSTAHTRGWEAGRAKGLALIKSARESLEAGEKPNPGQPPAPNLPAKE